ncbi:MAG: hypothetical protein WCJ89_07140 [Actinomycetes bacterium]
MRRIRVSLIAGIFFAASFLNPAQAVTKAGDSCKKAGISSISNGKKYTCVKSGKKLIWNKGVKDTSDADKAAAEKLAADKIAQDKLTADTAAAEKLAAEKLAADTAAVKSAQDKLVAEQAVAAKLAADRAVAHRATLVACPADGKCAIGNIGPGGGIVFYVALTPQSWGHYLEAAPASWSGNYVDPYTQWCSLGDTLLAELISNPDAAKKNSSAIGSGKTNTLLMLASCMNGIATAVSNYRGGGKSDWFVPSADEVTEMLKANIAIDDLSVSSYWSSTLAPVYGAWQQVIPVGTNYTSDETNAGSVRPIRAFGGG